MKRILLLLFLVSCTKEMNTVIFDYSFDSGPFPTKGMADEISSRLPGSITITLKGTNTYTIRTGEDVSIPYGDYEVTGTYTPEATQYIYGTTRFLSESPKIVVYDNISIIEGKSEYSVNASYGSFAVGVLPSETSSWKGMFKSQENSVNCIKTQNLWWTFVTGNFNSDSPFRMTLSSESGDTKTLFLYTDSPDSDGTLVEYGKWYIFHPTDTPIGSYSFGLNTPDWTNGN